jgi:exonuclease III
LKPSTVKLDIPGYQVFEQRRNKGNRGGIAIIVRKGIKISQYRGNEYAQGVCIDVQGGEKVWIGNIYMPPAPNLQRRGVDEEETRILIQDIVEEFPRNEKQIICGDWNTRVGELSPNIDDTVLKRKSRDKMTNIRTPWLIELCEIYGWHILNGIQPGPIACNTFHRGSDSSCIDLILSNTPTATMACDPATLKGLSDHALLTTTLRNSFFTRNS